MSTSILITLSFFAAYVFTGCAKDPSDQIRAMKRERPTHLPDKTPADLAVEFSSVHELSLKFLKEKSIESIYLSADSSHYYYHHESIRKPADQKSSTTIDTSFTVQVADLDSLYVLFRKARFYETADYDSSHHDGPVTELRLSYGKYLIRDNATSFHISVDSTGKAVQQDPKVPLYGAIDSIIAGVRRRK